MFFGRLAFVFEVMVYVGLGLPLLNLTLGLLGNLFGGANADVSTDAGGPELDFDLDAGGADLGADLSADIGGDLSADFGGEIADFGADLSAEFGGELADLGGDLSADFSADLAELGGDLSADISADLGELSADLSTELADLGAEAAAGRSVPTGSAAAGAPIRFNLYCLCLFMVIMGALGIFGLERFAGVARYGVLAGGFLLACSAYVLLYRLVIRPMQLNKAAALNMAQLRYRHALVTFRVKRDSPGKIQTRDAVGALITYPAELDPDICKLDRIDEGEEVIITELDRESGTCYITLAQRKLLSNE